MSATENRPDEDEGSFVIAQTREEWMVSVVKKAMRALYKLTFEKDLHNAILHAKMMATTEEQKEAAYLLAVFLREEMSGNLVPPPSLKKIYTTIVSEG